MAELLEPFEARLVQSEHTDKVGESWPRVPGDLRFCLVLLCFLLFFVGFPGFSTPGDFICRPYGKIRTVLKQHCI